MLSKRGLELTSLISSDFPKGCRSGTRRAKKASRRSLKRGSGRLVFVDSEGFDMPMSGCDKRQETCVGRRPCEQVEHLPIKKRRFLSTSPVTPPQNSSPKPGESSDVKSEAANVKSEAFVVKSEDTSAGSVVNIQYNCSKKEIEQGSDDTFCGISLLAAAACSTNLKKDLGPSEDASVPEGTQPQECTIENLNSCDSGPLKEEDLNYVYPAETASVAAYADHVTAPVPVLDSERSQADVEEDNKACSVSGEDNLPEGPQPQECIIENLKSCDSGPLKEEDLNSEYPAETASVAASADHVTVPLPVLNSERSQADVEEDSKACSVSGEDNLRFHWDLNVPMDAWEQPFDDPCPETIAPAVDVLPEAIKTTYEAEKDDTQRPGEPASLGQPTVRNMEDQKADVFNRREQPVGVSTESSVECQTDVDMGEANIEGKSAILQEASTISAGIPTPFHSEAVCLPVFDVVNEKAFSVSALEIQPESDASMRKVEDPANLLPTPPIVPSVLDVQEGLPSLSSDIAGPEVDQNLDNIEKVVAESNGESQINDMDTCEDSRVSLDIVRDSVAFSDKAIHVENPDAHCKNVASYMEMQVNDIFTLKEVVPYVSEEISLDLKNNVEPTDVNASCLPSVQNEASDRVSTGCDLMLTLDSRNELGVSVDKDIEPGAKSQSNVKETMPKFASTSDTGISASRNCFTGTHLEESASVKVGSGSFCNASFLLGTDSIDKPKVTDDTQYEDGELRESAELPWKECCEDQDCEHVDYGSDNEELYSGTVGNRHGSEVGKFVEANESKVDATNLSQSHCHETKDELGLGTLAASHSVCVNEDYPLKLNRSAVEKVGTSGLDEQPESNKSSSDGTSKVRDEGDGMDRVSSVIGDEFMDSETAEVRVRSLTSSKETQSRVDRPVDELPYRDGRLDRVGNNRFRYGDGVIRLYSREPSFRSSERLRYPLDNRPRGRQFDHWESPAEHRGVKRRYAAHYRGGYSTADDDEDDVDDGYRVANKFDRDPDVAPGGRPRFVRYNQVDNIAPRGRYNGHPPGDSFQSSLKFRHPLSRRNRSISPIGRRDYTLAHHPHETSPSRPRVRSPNARLSARTRSRGGSVANAYFRQRSGSPNCRSEGRMGRMRSPHHQPGYAADHVVGGYRSFPRSQGSPPCAPRYMGQRDEDLSHYMEPGYKQRHLILDRSPRRMRLPHDRADIIDSARNMKSDGYRRPGPQARFSEMEGPGRAVDGEESYEDRRKNYIPMHPERRRFEGGMGRRLHHDDAHDFPRRRPRGVEPRNEGAPRSFREEQQQFSADSDPFVDNGMESSRNMKSSEQYRSVRTDRFVDADGGASRGLMYEDDYDARRKAFLARRSEVEGIEKRLNLEADGEFGVNTKC